MSWSVSAHGKSDVVAKYIAISFAKSGKYHEPEESVKQAVAVLIEKALASNIPPVYVQVRASGSQSTMSQSGGPDRVSKWLKVEIETPGGYIE